MTIADSNSHTSTSPAPAGLYLHNLEALRNVDTLDGIVIDASNKFAKKPEEGIGSYFTYNYWFPIEQTERIKESILGMLVELNNNRESFAELSTGLKIRDNAIRELILKKLLPAEKYFDPHSLLRLKNVQNIIAPKLKELREFKQTAIQEILSTGDEPDFDKKNSGYDPKKALKKAKQLFYDKNPNYKMNISVAKAELMYDLKIGAGVNNKGATGSVIVSWFNKKKIAIFKPEDKKQFLLESIANQVKYWIGGQISHFKNALDAQPKAEVAAHIVAKYFGIDITCPTKLVKLGQSQGSFQLWAQGMEEIQDIYHLLETQPEYHHKEILLFQVMAILDFLLGNLDCHGGNCLIKPGKDGVLIDKLLKIDCANTFITHNTNRQLITDSKQYIWSSLKIAAINFCDEAKDIMEKVTEDAINEVIQIIEEALPGYLNENMITLFRQRAEVILAISTMEHYSPSELGQLQTDEELSEFLRKFSIMEDAIAVTRSDEEFEIIEDYASIKFQKISDDSDPE